MKRLCSLVLIFIFVSCGYTFEIDDILGVWNICEKSEESFYISNISQGSFYRTITSIVIVKNDNETFTFLVQGQRYLLSNVEKNGQNIVFNAQYDDFIFEKGNFEPYTFHASIMLHVIDIDTIWFEVDPVKSDPLFWKGDFDGKELIYWRAKKVDETKSQ